MPRQKGKSLLMFPEDCCVVDIETTGLDPEFCEIIEIAALKIRSGAVADRFSQLVQPAEPVDDFIVELTGITNDMLAAAPKLPDVLPAFRDFIAGDLIVGHNINFDINFLYDGSELLHLPNLSNDYVDTLRLARIVLPDLPHHRLKDLAAHYQIDYTNAHRADGDCAVTLDLLSRLRADAAAKGIDLSDYQHKKISAKDVTAQTDDFDASHPIYGKLCVFTGALSRMQRKDAMQLVVNLGGSCGDSVTKKTNYLIIGSAEYSTNVKGNKTAKMRKAEELILKGCDLAILSENAFFDMIEQS